MDHNALINITINTNAERIHYDDWVVSTVAVLGDESYRPYRPICYHSALKLLRFRGNVPGNF